ncbi:Cof-type HAD-IIB family hydrolase [Aquibacillus saliphilus]|uniref:Cof-type HAD-IIB family hydrolase n=1 Tax=Aquibacillus saliphilus TaxID=1909422 RepID=UPI001CF0252A|nr:Cof-type HAD-IIB family hydrolase [Aquibacillus saliphilus]
MPYKMIVLDLDDTLLRDDHTISDRTKQALMKAQEEGVKVVLASGRPTFGMNPIADELSLDQFGSFILSFNGGKIINYQSKEELFSSTLSVKDVEKLYELSRREGVYIHTYVGDEIITEDENPFTTIESDITGLPIKLVNKFIESVTEPVVKTLMVGEPDKMKLVETKLQAELAEEFSTMRSKPYFLEFTEKGVTKGTSLNHLIQACGIKREEVIAIGDSYNDQAMIEFAGLGVAMGNAPDDIKEIADVVADSNMNDGVAKIVETFVLNNLVTNK